jgi:restriction endonuclease S subunit
MKLDDITSLSLGKTPSRSNPEFWDKEKNSKNIWLSIADLSASNQLYIDDSKEYVSDEGAKLFKEVPAETLIMSFKLSIGKLAITKCALRTNEAIIAMPIKDEKLISKEYLYYFLSSLNWDVIAGKDIKVKGKTLNKAKLKELPILVPPLAEQERIVAKLDAAFAEIESLNKIASIRKAELAKLKEALLLKTLSPEKSDLINLGDVCELIYGKGLDKIYRLENDGIPAYGANGIKSYSTKILSDEPSIIIGRKGSAGELTRVYSAFWALDVTYYTKINKKLIDLDFLYYTLSSMDLPSMAKGVKPGINRNDVYKRLIHLPTLEEQKHIVSILDEAYIAIEKVNDLVSKLKNNCDALQTAILKQELQPSEAA